MKRQELKEKLQPYVRGSMIGLAIGDALGMPVETMTYEEIMAVTNGKGITDFVAPIQKKFKSCRNFLPGQWTDDTQLALAVAESLIRSKGFNLEDQALAHVEAYKESTRGWGGTTKKSIEEIMNGIRKPNEPAKDKPDGGAGNGVAMKIAPLAIFHALKATHLREKYYPCTYRIFKNDAITLGLMTHHNFKASIGALLVGNEIINQVHYRTGISPAQIGFNPLDWSKLIEEEIFDERLRGVLDMEKSFRKNLLPSLMTRDVEGLRGVTGMGFHVVDTVCFVLGIYRQMSYPYNFEDSIIKTISSGGDADTNAAMVGAILGAKLGIDAIPQRWLDGLYKRDEIIKVADDLLDVSLE